MTIPDFEKSKKIVKLEIILNKSVKNSGKLTKIVAQCPKGKINIMRILSTCTDSTGFLCKFHLLIK